MFNQLPIDRSFKSINKIEEPAINLMSCLHHRTHLSLTEVSKDTQLEVNRQTSRTKISNCAALSLFDTLLKLLQDQESAGRVELFRLLLERRCPVPVFLPSSECHLKLLYHLNSNLGTTTSINLGDNVTLMRVAIISCREKRYSQTTEILKNVFNIDSFHREDYSRRSLTALPLAAEIGLGCVSHPQVEQFLVLHVLGDFKPLWDLIAEFCDYLIVEDTPGKKNHALGQLQVIKSNHLTEQLLKEKSIVIWQPSNYELKDKVIDNKDFPYYSIQSPIGTQLYVHLASDILNKHQNWKTNLKYSFRKSLDEMNLPGMHNIKCSVRFVEQTVHHVPEFETLRVKAFVLQNNFNQQAQLEEQKSRFRNDEEQVMMLDREIKQLMVLRKKLVSDVQNHPMIHLMKTVLENPDPNFRILGMLQLQTSLAKQCDALLTSLRKTIDQLAAELSKSYSETNNGTEKLRIQKMLHDAKKKYNETIVGTEHIWREMSHIYDSNHLKYHSYTELAAQHLIDGMCIELLDGDSNMINIPWIDAVLRETDNRLKKNGNSPRIFVLSIMGVQSSGKSTLLNIMFGVQMKTSAGQCTRGINMQLIPTVDRKEYDYILLLDTEGTRAPEYWGLPGSEKRDNQMATVSILLADATIIVNPGENDAAIKEMLPIVLLAYQGSELAEEKGGQMSSMLFFVYNRIDTSEKDKLSNIFQVLERSLQEAIKAVYQLSGTSPEPSGGAPSNSSRLFQRFKLDASNSEDSDVRILGNHKKSFNPPDDVPDPAYGAALAEFRQHIHNRVTGSPQWKSRTLPDFLTYLNLVWQCIQSADFNLNFKTVLERANYDQMNLEIKACERQLSEEYKAKFGLIETQILMDKAEQRRSTDDLSIDNFKRQLSNEVRPKVAELDEEMKEIFSKSGRDKWEFGFLDLWMSFKKEQENHWNGLLERFINYQLKFDFWTDHLKKQMRRRIRDTFKDTNPGNLSIEQKEELFKELHDEILEIARETQPNVNVVDRVNQVYRKNPLIQVLPTEVFDANSELEADEVIQNILLQRSKGDSYFPDPNQGKCTLNYRNWYSRNLDDERQTFHVYEDLFNRITGLLQDKHYFVDSIVDEVIAITRSVLTDRQFLLHNELKNAHIFAKQLVTRNMTDIQSEWEKKNSVYAKLIQPESITEMRTYFDEASQGVVDMQLFFVMLKSNFKNILAEAFEEEVILLTMGKVSYKNWLLDPKALLDYMDLKLLELIDKNQIFEALELLTKPQQFYEDVMLNLIEKECPNMDTEWATFCDRVKRAINLSASASSEVASGRAKSFIAELQLQGFQVGFRNNFLVKNFTSDSDGYDGCANEDAEVFRQQLKALAEVIDKIGHPFHQEHSGELSRKILNRLREGNKEGARPRCNEACPLCGSFCILPFGHGLTTKHDTLHQPQGLSGWTWQSKSKSAKFDTLCAANCTKGYRKFMYKGKMCSKRDFATLFPDWREPAFTDQFPLREYMFVTFNETIAKMYSTQPSTDIPAEYFHNLENIRANILERTSSAK